MEQDRSYIVIYHIAASSSRRVTGVKKARRAIRDAPFPSLCVQCSRDMVADGILYCEVVDELTGDIVFSDEPGKEVDALSG